MFFNIWITRTAPQGSCMASPVGPNSPPYTLHSVVVYQHEPPDDIAIVVFYLARCPNHLTLSRQLRVFRC